MQYKILKLDEYDKSLKIDGKKILCYSPKSFKDLKEEKTIVGEVYDYDDDQDAEVALALGKKRYAVCEPGKTSRVRYSCRGYVAVDRNRYLALYKSRIPFILWLLGILIVGIISLFLLMKFGTPEEVLVNPLPPVDSNVEALAYDPNTPSETLEEGGKVNMIYRPSITLSLSTGQLDIGFENPSESTHDVVIVLYLLSGEGDAAVEYEIAESGRIPSGTGLSLMTLNCDPSIFNGTGTYLARYHVKYYEPDTGIKANLDAVLDQIELKVEN